MCVRSALASALACALGACMPRPPAPVRSQPVERRAASSAPIAAPRRAPTLATDAPRAAPPAETPSTPRAPVPHFTDLPVPGHQPARLWVPGGRATRPLIVVAHGAGGRAEWHCELWRKITGGDAFILCPRGTRIYPRASSGYFFRNDPALESEVLAAVGALRAAYARVDPGPAVYAGYSQGAIMGALMAHRHPDLFPRLVLVEGGHDWDIPSARHWHDGGGKRVLFVCGRRVCDTDAKAARGWLEHVGVETRVEYAPGAGHTPAGRVAERAGAAFDWVVEDDARWRRPDDAARQPSRNQCVLSPQVAHNAPGPSSQLRKIARRPRGTAIAGRGCPSGDKRSLP